jgi:hypothetical protein
MRLLFFLLFISNFLNAQQPFKAKPKYSLPPITKGHDIIFKMHEKYKGKWYKYFTFTQDAIFYNKEGAVEKKEVWYEAAMFPGNLTIKFHSMDSKDGVVFAKRKVTSIKDGIPGEAKPFIHDLLLVGFDVYFLSPKTTCKLLDSLGYNLHIWRTDTMAGRNVYVVGAQQNDNETNQFWIDVEGLYMHKIIYKKGKNIQEVIFADYTLMDGNWVSKTIIFKSNHQLQLIEKYYDISFPKDLKPEIFDPARFSTISWK